LDVDCEEAGEETFPVEDEVLAGEGFEEND
jgi:hypothetical protein